MNFRQLDQLWGLVVLGLICLGFGLAVVGVIVSIV
jgi:hypothetical protein